MNNHNINKIAVAQINFIAGDMEYNSKKILKYISLAQKSDADIILFQQNAILGYSMNDVLNRYPTLVEENKKWLKNIAKLTNNITAVIGYIDKKDGYLNNSFAVIENSQITKIIDSQKDNLLNLNNTTFCFLSEYNNEFNNKNLKDTDIIVCAIPTIATESEMHNITDGIKKLSDYTQNTAIFINSIGATDSIVYCGESSVFHRGIIKARAKSFDEDLMIYDFKNNNGIINDSSIKYSVKSKFSLDYEDELERIYKTVVLGIKDYFKKNGIKRACLGLSGGLDSTVCAVLLADALGKENVYGLSMPSKITSNESKSDAKILASNLGIGFSEVPIETVVKSTENMFENIFNNVGTYWNNRYKESFTKDNIQARTRATYLWGISNEFASCTPIATSDKSESYMGYATINGDMSGGFAPIADITKTKLFALARWLNKNRTEKNSIPETIISKSPCAELAIDERTGKPLKAEDALMPYEFLDEIIWRTEHNHETYEYMLDSKFLYEEKNELPKSVKAEWLDKFYKRMQTAVFKWSILPPAIILDNETINTNFYKYPISSKINFKQLSNNEIEGKISE